MSIIHATIIGSAGRKEDTIKMNKDLYKWMFTDALSRTEKFMKDKKKEITVLKKKVNAMSKKKATKKKTTKKKATKKKVAKKKTTKKKTVRKK